MSLYIEVKCHSCGQEFVTEVVAASPFRKGGEQLPVDKYTWYRSTVCPECKTWFAFTVSIQTTVRTYKIKGNVKVR